MTAPGPLTTDRTRGRVGPGPNLRRAKSEPVAEYSVGIQNCLLSSEVEYNGGTEKSESHDFSGGHHAGLKHSQPVNAAIDS